MKQYIKYSADKTRKKYIDTKMKQYIKHGTEKTSKETYT
jgi:hypothetical protein